MTKKVSPQEIQRLYRFTREHYVEYYDLQTELVDHLATGIEKTPLPGCLLSPSP